MTTCIHCDRPAARRRKTCDVCHGELCASARAVVDTVTLAMVSADLTTLIEAVEHLRACAGDERADPGSVAAMRLDRAKRRVDDILAYLRK